MKLLRISLLLNLLSIIVSGQTLDTTSTKIDTSRFRTTNAFLTPQINYETFNNSFFTGNSVATIRSQDNPRILIDGIPINPILLNNTYYNEFLGHMHLLSFDIQGVNVHTLQNDSRIVSGNYNNAISFNTSNIQLGKSAYQFEANNYTTLAYQDFDSMGYATIFNFKVQKSYEKFGYRVSINNGFQNDYIPENGLQRYGGNLKLKYNPIKPLLITGFLDYTHFEDFKRSGEKIQDTVRYLTIIDENNIQWNEFFINIGENKQTSNRLFTYINADLNLTEWLAIYGKYSYNNVSDSSKRYLDFNGTSLNGNPYNETYDEKRNYKYTSSYFDIGLSFKKLIEENTSINLTLGYNRNGLKYFDAVYKYYRYSSGNSYSNSYSYNKGEPIETEKVIYSSLKLQTKQLTLSYLFNKTFYGFDHLSFKDKENKSFTNHLVSLNYEFIKNDDKKINHLVIGATYGKLANYSIIPQAGYSTTNSGNSSWYQYGIDGNSGSQNNPQTVSYGPECIVAFNNNNIELDLFSSFLRKRIDFSFTYYYKNYKEFDHLYWNYNYDTNIENSFLANVGKVTKDGFVLNGNFHIIRNNSLDWLMNLSFSENSTELEHNKELPFRISDTTINNTIISIVNNFRYNNFQLFIEFEGKNGYDLNLYKNNLTVAEPFTYWERNQITEVNNKGIPTSEIIENSGKYITDTKYFVLKQIELQYQINDYLRNKTYVIGLQYNKMRRLYLYVNDIEKYQEQFQQPSFYNAISLSFTMKF